MSPSSAISLRLTPRHKKNGGGRPKNKQHPRQHPPSHQFLQLVVFLSVRLPFPLTSLPPCLDMYVRLLCRVLCICLLAWLPTSRLFVRLSTFSCPPVHQHAQPDDQSSLPASSPSFLCQAGLPGWSGDSCSSSPGSPPNQPRCDRFFIPKLNSHSIVGFEYITG